MRPISLNILAIVALFAIIFCSHSNGYHVSSESLSLSYNDNIEGLPRVRRQVETFDDEYPTAAGQDTQEETSFWDRVVKVALKLFSRFVEWLNS